MSPLTVKITVDVRGRQVALEQVADPAARRTLGELGANVGKMLAPIRCSVHGQGPTEVRVHIDAQGSADVRYESCCLKLRDAVGKALG